MTQKQDDPTQAVQYEAASAEMHVTDDGEAYTEKKAVEKTHDITKLHAVEVPAVEHVFCPKSSVLCHVIRRTVYEHPGYHREDIIPRNRGLQVARVHANSGKTFQPHHHKPITVPQDESVHREKCETWIVIRGLAEAHLYGKPSPPTGKAVGAHAASYIKTVVLRPGDILTTVSGGHGYRVLQDDTVIIEVKNGPYTGVNDDKTTTVQRTDEPEDVRELWQNKDATSAYL